MAITLTLAASDHVRRFLCKRGKGLGVRVKIKTTGCSGYAYALEYADSIEPTDRVFDNDGVKVVVDDKSLVLTDGMELDFVKEGLSEGFKFVNPKEKGRCGCGESFSV